jgi:AraC family transcriptional regulator of adaptative response/methylated-DNA-[protein]-cysteine methyltransferase
MFGEEPAVLENALAEEFPRAERVRDDAALAGWAQTLREHLQSAGPLPDLPLDLQGTAFQQRVWAELRRIPSGQTRSYTEVAQAIGQPTAVRAVARACATNKVALLIPCHRVVRSGGQLAGYRWGLARKQALLAEEQKK